MKQPENRNDSMDQSASMYSFFKKKSFKELPVKNVESRIMNHSLDNQSLNG